jgi:hypothetical protein
MPTLYSTKLDREPYFCNTLGALISNWSLSLRPLKKKVLTPNLPFKKTYPSLTNLFIFVVQIAFLITEIKWIWRPCVAFNVCFHVSRLIMWVEVSAQKVNFGTFGVFPRKWREVNCDFWTSRSYELKLREWSTWKIRRKRARIRISAIFRRTTISGGRTVGNNHQPCW